ncbi:hypothetical protein D3C85_1524730 [compost metagenome]
MLQPPVSDLAPWRPGHWITSTGYSLNEIDLSNGVKDDRRFCSMLDAVNSTDRVLKKVMQK